MSLVDAGDDTLCGTADDGAILQIPAELPSQYVRNGTETRHKIVQSYLGKLSRPHCDLTGIIVNKGNHPQMALIQVSEIL